MFRNALAKVSRHWGILAAFVAAGLLLSLYYVATATPKYTATGSVFIDPRVGDAPETSAAATPALLLTDALTVDSEIRVVTSREVTANATRALGLGEEEVVEEPTALQRWFSWLSSTANPDAPSNEFSEDVKAALRFETARQSFVDDLTVERAGDTFVIDLQYTSSDPGFATEAVNTIIREYMQVSAERKVANTQNTRDWLSGRLDEVSNDVGDAERAVAEFRWGNELLAPEGQLLSGETLQSARTELVTVQNEILALKVNVENMTQQIEGGDLDAIDIPAEDRSLTALVNYEAMLADQLFKEQELLLRYDANSEVVANNQLIQDRTRELIATELGKVRDRMVSQLEVLELRADETRARIAALTDEFGSDVTKQVELQNLERAAQAKRALYERLSEEFDRATQLLSYDTSSAQVIGWAVVPTDKSSPKSKQIVLLSVFGALVLGLSSILLTEELDDRFRSAKDVHRELGLDLIGVIPRFNSDIKRRLKTAGSPIPKSKLGRKWRRLGKNLYFAVQYPASITAQAMRTLHVDLSSGKSKRGVRKPNTVVGFTSSVRAEGKTTTAMNFATFLAHRGESVALLDFDFLAFNMSRQLRPILTSENKLVELIAGPAEMAPQLIPVAAFPNLYFVGAVSQQPIGAPTPKELEKLETVIEVLRGQFDMVVVDLPPLRGVSETRLLANLCDKVVFMIDWSKTPKAVAAGAMRKWSPPKEKILGAMYSKASLRQYNSYNRHEIHDYYG